MNFKRDKVFRGYRWQYEPSYYAERGSDRKGVECPELMIIPCRRGHIYVHGPGMLGLCVDKPGRRRADILAFATVLQDEGKAFNAVCPVAAFSLAARLLGARRKRVLSPEQREAATARLASMRLAKGSNK